MALVVLCEYAEHPMGIDMPAPRFSWRVRETRSGYQTAYRIVVLRIGAGSAPDVLVWDTGAVESDESVHIPYGGEPLESATAYRIEVSLRDDMPAWSETGGTTFTMGLLDSSLWQALWTGLPGMNATAALCRWAFALPGPWCKAYAFIASPNYQILTCNGIRPTDSVLDNVVTDPERSMPYRMLDITGLLQPGNNVIGVELGRGWPGLVLSMDGDGIGEMRFACMLLWIDPEGGRHVLAGTAADWRFTMDGPVVYDSIYHGETFDARKVPVGWNLPGFRETSTPAVWQGMMEFEPPGGHLCAQLLEPIRVVETLAPVAVHALPDGTYTFDMGQNFAGWARLRVRARHGERVVLSYAELVDDAFRLNRISLRRARAVDTYVAAGGGEEVYEPRFTYHGFRYVHVAGLSEPPGDDTIVGCVVHSDVRRVGDFHCSSNLLNDLYRNAVWTERSNLHGIPTDCPQRDERLAWTNDMVVRHEAALYLYDLSRLYTKWMRDLRDAQGRKSGALTDTAPFFRYGSRPCDPVAITSALLPWRMHGFYGDRRILEENLPMNVAWAGYLTRNQDGHLVRSSQMGDWAGPASGTVASQADGIGGGAISTITTSILVASAQVRNFHRILADTARLLGEAVLETASRAEAEAIRRALVEAFYDAGRGGFASNSQGANAIALHADLPDAESTPAVLTNLVHDLVQLQGTHLTTGNLCSSFLVEELFRHGQADLAFELLTQTTYPSWGYMVGQGATTMWERWENVVDSDSVLAGMASRNHPMNAAFTASFHRDLAGIRFDPEQPGFRRVIVEPHPPRQLASVEASLDTIRGRVSVAWRQYEACFEMEVTIPFNCIGEVRLPLRENARDRVVVNDVEMDRDTIAAEWIQIGDPADRSITAGGLRIVGCQRGRVFLELPAGQHRITRAPSREG